MTLLCIELWRPQTQYVTDKRMRMKLALKPRTIHTHHSRLVYTFCGFLLTNAVFVMLEEYNWAHSWSMMCGPCALCLICTSLQDEKNEMINTNLWLNYVSTSSVTRHCRVFKFCFFDTLLWKPMLLFTWTCLLVFSDYICLSLIHIWRCRRRG